ncbi:MAG TPA: lysophospholipid acyltransferase family protein [Candidatus Ozemobacteraceae bacterium]|nr:lysophospholipid acyltransferase family protein [Candidatus Ozemobacteraceae bacterium]
MSTVVKSRNASLFQKLQCLLLDRAAAMSAKASPAGRRRAAGLLTCAVFDLLHLRRSYVTEALQNHLGLDAAAAGSTARQTYRSFFENALEMASLPYLTAEEVRGKFRAEGIEHLQAAHALGRGVIIVSGHYGLWEFVPPWLCLNGFHMTTVVRRQDNPDVDLWFEKMRQRFGAATTDSGFGLREILRTLRNGDLLGLMSDQNAGDRGCFVNFLGEVASTVVGPAQIAMKSRAPVVALAAHRCGDGPHLIEIKPPIRPEDYSNDEIGRTTLTQHITSLIESWVRKRPDQWFWLHRRWKSRPSADGKELPVKESDGSSIA